MRSQHKLSRSLHQQHASYALLLVWRINGYMNVASDKLQQSSPPKDDSSSRPTSAGSAGSGHTRNGPSSSGSSTMKSGRKIKIPLLHVVVYSPRIPLVIPVVVPYTIPYITCLELRLRLMSPTGMPFRTARCGLSALKSWPLTRLIQGVSLRARRKCENSKALEMSRNTCLTLRPLYIFVGSTHGGEWRNCPGQTVCRAKSYGNLAHMKNRAGS